MRTGSRVALAAAIGLTILLAGTAPAMAKVIDRNHNKIPDKWEKKYHMSLRKNQAKLDFDKDGLSNINEYLAGTNPRVKDTNHNGVRDGLEDRDKDGLVNLAEVKAKTNIRVADTDKDGVIDSLEDPDGDSLDNAQEWLTGTDPLEADTDGNGVPDGQEDADEDGLNNVQEFIIGTNPRQADSNHNGIGDADEDSDGDGIDNHTEFEEGSDPNEADSDGDGVKDGQEIRGAVTSFDPATGLLSIQVPSEPDEQVVSYEVVVNTATVLAWAECEDVPAPADAPTLVDLFEGVMLSDVKTAKQADGSLLATEIRIKPEPAPDEQDPTDPGALVAEVSAWNSDTSILTLLDLTSDAGTYELLIDDATTFMWADGTTGDHEPGVADLVEGAGVAGVESFGVDDGPQVATLIVLVPSVEVPAE